MSTAVANKQDSRSISNAKEYRDHVTKIASFVLADWVGEEKARESIGRVSVALNAASASAKNPKDFYDCTPQSVATVVAVSALTGIMPSTGAGALAWVIPRRDRKGEPPKLRYQLSHRGLNALAARAGMMMVAIPISKSDKVSLNAFGEVDLSGIDIENPPTTEDEFRGICVAVKSIGSGALITQNYIPKKVIDKRRAASDSYQFAESNDWAKATDPWHKWYVEMAMKTAMHYAISRGWCIIDDAAAQRALTLDVESDLPAITGPESSGQSKLDQMANVLNPEVIDVEAKPTEEPDHVARIKSDIKSAKDIGAVQSLFDEASALTDAGEISDAQLGDITAAANVRSEELEGAK